MISVAPSPAASTIVGGRSKVLNKSNSFSGGGGSNDISAPGGSGGPSSHNRGQLCSAAGNLVASSSHQGTSSNKKGKSVFPIEVGGVAGDLELTPFQNTPTLVRNSKMFEMVDKSI